MCIIAAGVEYTHAHYLIITDTSSSVVVLFTLSMHVAFCAWCQCPSTTLNLGIYCTRRVKMRDNIFFFFLFLSSQHLFFSSFILCALKKKQHTERRKIRKQQREKNVKRNFSFFLSVVVVATTYVSFMFYGSFYTLKKVTKIFLVT